MTLLDNLATQTLTLSAASNQLTITPNNGVKYTFTASNLSADCVYMIIDFGADDILMFLNVLQTLTNKLLKKLNTINTASNIQSNIPNDMQIWYTQNVDGSQLFGNDLDDEYIIEPVRTLAAKVKKVMCFENKVIKNKDKPFMNDLLEWRDNYIV